MLCLITAPCCSCSLYETAAASLLSSTPRMAVCVRSACVEMRLLKVLLSSCVNYTKIHQPFVGNFYAKRIFSTAAPLFSRIGGTSKTCRAHTGVHPLKFTVPPENSKQVLNIRSYSDTGLNTVCRQILPSSRCQPKRSQNALQRHEDMLPGGAAPSGKTADSYCLMVKETHHLSKLTKFILIVILVSDVPYCKIWYLTNTK